MPLFFLDIGVSVVVAMGLTAVLVRAFRLHGPWQHSWAVWLAVFLASWGGGVWFAASPATYEVGWVGYCLPFVLVGLAAAVAIAVISPLHALATTSDREAFEREERAVGAGVLLFFWSLCALLLAVVVRGYAIR
jgi:hypothetical protein